MDSPAGGGIAIFGDGSIGQIELTNVTVTDNEVVTDFGNAQGGGIWVGSGGPVLTRVRLNDNDVVPRTTQVAAGPI